MSNRNKTILHVVSSGGFYGAERVIVELSLGLKAIGWNAEILALDSQGSPSLVDTANSLGINSRKLPTGANREFSELIAANSIDIVHSHGYKSDFLVATLPPRTPVKRVATCHGWITTSPKLALYEFIDKSVLRCFDRVAAVSTSIEHSLLRWRVGRRRVCLIENGVDTQPPRLEARNRIRSGLALTTHQLLVLMVGRLDRSKGVADALRAIKQLVAIGHDVVLAIAGDGDERERLGQLAISLGITDRTFFLGYRDDISDLMEAADVFVIASHKEGLPIVLLEAMALARPIVATRVGEIANVLAGSGRLLNAGDVDALAAAIASVFLHPVDTRRLAAAAGERYRERYSRAAMVARYAALYSSMY